MKTKTEDDNPTRATLKWCFLLILIYLVFILILPVKNATVFHYHLTSFGYRIIEIIISIPSLIVWLVAFWGYGLLQSYSDALGKNSEAKSYNNLAKGLQWLAWSLPLSAIANRILGANNSPTSAFHTFEIILSNYIYLVIPLVAFVFVWQAVRQISTVRVNSLSINFSSLLIVVFIFFGIVYCYLLLKNFNLSSLGSSNNPYKLPAWLMILTIMIPYLYAWFIGMFAAIELNLYSSKVQGVIYKRALSFLSYGLSLIIIGFVALQYVSTTHPVYGNIDFNTRTLLGIVFRIIVGLGFILLSLGAHKLKRIEEV